MRGLRSVAQPLRAAYGFAVANVGAVLGGRGVATLDSHRQLGRSGLLVSPLALGAMTFGWGADRDAARAIFTAYVEAGGNKSMVRSVEQSLSRLRTEYLDLLYLHIWDGRTPVEEVLRAMDDLVRAGKVLYLGISDIPAWQVSRMQAVADLRGWAPLVALQIPYNLVERTVERDLVPMADTMGLGVVAWSPLAGGVLTGKYGRSDLEPDAGGAGFTRRQHAVGNGFLTARGLEIAGVVKDVAAEIGTTSSRIALAWTLLNPVVTAPIVGARTRDQLEDNLAALEVEFDQHHQEQLDAASAVDLGFPHEALRRFGYAR
jgi:aryl-alcohol dehydrogenase-like predicted oxidoreductase